MDQASSQSASFEQGLEHDLAALAADIRNRKESITVKDYSERELVKEAIRAFPSFERTPQASSGTAPVSTPPAPAPAVPAATASPLPEYAQSAPPEVKLEIEYLLDVALRHGIGKALTESEKSPYFVQDAFHDALAGRLYPELQKRGIVK